jgi:hypothetical protein
VCNILVHDRPPFACGSVPHRNNPRLCDRSGRSFHIVYSQSLTRAGGLDSRSVR